MGLLNLFGGGDETSSSTVNNTSEVNKQTSSQVGAGALNIQDSGPVGSINISTSDAQVIEQGIRPAVEAIRATSGAFDAAEALGMEAMMTARDFGAEVSRSNLQTLDAQERSFGNFLREAGDMVTSVFDFSGESSESAYDFAKNQADIAGRSIQSAVQAGSAATGAAIKAVSESARSGGENVSKDVVKIVTVVAIAAALAYLGKGFIK